MVALAEFLYNTSPHLSTKMIPFRALYGRDPSPLIKYEQGTISVDGLHHLLLQRDTVIDDLHMNLIHV